jgi:hypothetical protein
MKLAEAFDHAARLPSLTDSKTPELRAWILPFIGNQEGYVIAPERALRCSVEYRNDGRTATVEHGHCSPLAIPIEKSRAALDLLPQLATLADRSWGCALDGTSYLVEGSTNGGRFAFFVSNPGAGTCRDRDSSLAGELAYILRDL